MGLNEKYVLIFHVNFYLTNVYVLYLVTNANSEGSIALHYTIYFSLEMHPLLH